MAFITYRCRIGAPRWRVSACNSGNKEQQPTAAEQKQIQDGTRKAMEQQKQLTSGEGNSMCGTHLSTEYAPGKTKNSRAQPIKESQAEAKQQPRSIRSNEEESK